MNWFVIGLITLQTSAAVWYYVKDAKLYGLLFLVYAASNVILFLMERAGK